MIESITDVIVAWGRLSPAAMRLISLGISSSLMSVLLWPVKAQGSCLFGCGLNLILRSTPTDSIVPLGQLLADRLPIRLFTEKKRQVWPGR
jgi:hypothetical protein